jgi:hypothetical protein
MDLMIRTTEEKIRDFWSIIKFILKLDEEIIIIDQSTKIIELSGIRRNDENVIILKTLRVKEIFFNMKRFSLR